MERTIANEIVTTLHASSFLVDKTLSEVKATCSHEPFRACCKLLGYVMADMLDALIAPIYDEHPDLAPDWYRDGPQPGKWKISRLKLPPEARQALLTAFEAAYENVQSAMGRISQLSDPLEVAFYSQGLHQISVSLCRARVTLLMAEPE